MALAAVKVKRDDGDDGDERGRGCSDVRAGGSTAAVLRFALCSAVPCCDGCDE
jgi:hypothetical protein